MTQYPQNNSDNQQLHISENNTEAEESDMDDIIEDEQIMDDDAYENKIVNNKTYIGLPLYEPTTGLLFGCHTSAHTFYKYQIEKVCKFLKTMSCSDSVSNRNYPEIMKLVQTNTTTESGLEFTIHTVLLKTMWLRMVQRRWKKTMDERRRIINGRMSQRNRKYSEITGHHLPEYSVLPGLRGCLADIR